MLYQLLLLLCHLTICHLTITLTLPHPTHPSPDRLRLPSSRQDETVFCESWRFSVETNDAGNWTGVPRRCHEFVRTYMTGPRYQSDTYFAAEPALSFVRGLNVSSDGMDAWVFGVDDTLLSCLPYYQRHGFGSEVFNEVSFYEWASLADAPPIAASWTLYKELQARGFTIFILTGRDEHFRAVTEANLHFAGYTHYKRLILRGDSDKGTLAAEYKSSKRKEIVEEGYRIRGISGDQWSDLLGNVIAQRSFKLPNIMYYIP
ncbi:hypothetical protein vseg_016318 [Gypsophila vaccaria]